MTQKEFENGMANKSVCLRLTMRNHFANPYYMYLKYHPDTSLGREGRGRPQELQAWLHRIGGPQGNFLRQNLSPAKFIEPRELFLNGG